VKAAIAQIGYVPNLLAGGLRSNRSKLVAALIPTLVSPVYNETVQALTSALRSRGYQLMLGQSGYAEAIEDELLDAIIGRRPDGIVLTGVMHSASARKRLIASGIPVVETWDLTPEPIDMLVGFSHVAVAEATCRFLYGRGYQRLGVIGADDDRARLRSATFVKTALGLGLAEPPIAEVEAPTTLASGRKSLSHFLNGGYRPDAIFCSSDLLALGVMTEAHALGMEIPRDFAVMGYGDLGFAQDLHPALTTVRIDGTRIGMEAARCIVDRVEGSLSEPCVIDIGFEIIQRVSA
jgi:LacI family gluconate utilization system Gnt-I transcriptional repressor